MTSLRARRTTLSTSSMNLACCNRFLMRMFKSLPTFKRRFNRSLKTRLRLESTIKLKIGLQSILLESQTKTGSLKFGTLERNQAPMLHILRQSMRSKKWQTTTKLIQTYTIVRSVLCITCLPKISKIWRWKIKSLIRSRRLSQK